MDAPWPGKWVKLLRPKRLSKIDVVILGNFIEVRLHWTADGNIPCIGRPGCKLCPSSAKPRHYAPVQHSVNGVRKPGILEIFDDQMERIEEFPCSRGLRLKLGKDRGGHLQIVMLEEVPREFVDRICREFDVRPFLERIFGAPLMEERKSLEDGSILKFRKQA